MVFEKEGEAEGGLLLFLHEGGFHDAGPEALELLDAAEAGEARGEGGGEEGGGRGGVVEGRVWGGGGWEGGLG